LTKTLFWDHSTSNNQLMLTSRVLKKLTSRVERFSTEVKRLKEERATLCCQQLLQTLLMMLKLFKLKSLHLSCIFSSSKISMKLLSGTTRFLKAYPLHFTPRICKTSSNGWVQPEVTVDLSIAISEHQVQRLEELSEEKKKPEVVENLEVMPGSNT
jgi:hypothetical protein